MELQRRPEYDLMRPRPTPKAGWLEEIRGWCQGRWWLPRLLLWLFMARLWILQWRDPDRQTLFHGLDLGIHELGHMVFAPLGELPGLLGGSVLQCLIPLVGLWMFHRQRDPFAMTFAFAWLSINFFEVATYMADAQRMELDLVSPFAGDDIVHDWNAILGRIGLLPYCEGLARTLRIFAHLTMAAFLGPGAWLTWNMFRSRYTH